MPIYTLMIREVWVRTVRIEADSLKEAMRAYGEGTELDLHENLEYSHCLDATNWVAGDDEGNIFHGGELAKIAKELGAEKNG